MITIQIIEELNKEYNSIRSLYQNRELNFKEVQKLIKFIPCAQNQLSILVKNGLLTKKLERGKYAFPTEEVLFINFKHTVEELRSKTKEINQRYKIRHTPVTNVNEAIKDFLKRTKLTNKQLAQYLVSTNNYKVTVKKITWDEL